MATADSITGLPPHLQDCNEDSFLCHVVTELSDLDIATDLVEAVRDSSYTHELTLELYR